MSDGLDVEVLVEVDARWSARFAVAAWRLRFVIGECRAQALAMWIARRFARWRVDGGRWQRGLVRAGDAVWAVPAQDRP